MNGWRHFCLGILLALLLVAGESCTEAPEPQGAQERTDSAGIEIVHLGAMAWEELQTLDLAPSPILSIGAVEGPEEQILNQVSGVAPLDDGRLAVLDGGSSEIRIFDRDGELVSRHGRDGEGPGEYRWAGGVWSLPGDTLVVQDMELHRVTVLSPEGEVTRVITLRGDPIYNTVIGVLADGSFVQNSGRYRGPPTASGQEVIRYYTRLSPTGDSLNVLGDFVWIDTIRARMSDARRDDPPLFRGWATAAVTADGMWAGWSDEDEVVHLNGEGDVDRIVRWADPNRAVTDEVKEAYLRDHGRVLEETQGRASQTARTRDRAFADSMESHGTLVPRSDGGFWMEEPWRPGSGLTFRGWRIFGAGGQPEGRIQLPLRTPLLWAGPGEVILLEWDDLGVHYLRVYSIVPRVDAR